MLTGRSYGAYVCVYFPVSGVSGRESLGWLRSSDLMTLPVPTTPGLEAWTGDWVEAEDKIRLSVQGKNLAVHGEAIWYAGVKGVDDPLTAEVDGVGRPSGASVTFVDDGCRVQLRLIGPYLAATDNRQCGGVGVGFHGFYSHKITAAMSPRPPRR